LRGILSTRPREAGKIENDLKVIVSQKIGLRGCTMVHKFAQFLKQRFFHAAPVLAGPGRPAQSAQKEVVLARRRGGGASARKGGKGWGISSAIRRLPGAHVDG